MKRRTFLLLPLAALPVLALAQTSPPDAMAIGDSITTGHGATTPTQGGYAFVVAAALGWSLDNRAVGGSTIATQWPAIQADTAPITVWTTGYNDMRIATDPDTYAAQLSDAVGWLAGPTRTLYLGNCLRMADYGPPGYWGRGSDELVVAYNARIAAVVASARAAGRVVFLVDACAAYDPLTMLAADQVHPDDSGHQAIAQAFLEVIHRRVLLPFVTTADAAYPAP